MDNLRDLRDNTIYYITNRTFGKQHWLKYDEHIVNLAETWLARAATFFGVKIYFVFRKGLALQLREGIEKGGLSDCAF